MISPSVTALDPNEAPEQSNSWAEDSLEHRHWAITTASLQEAPCPDSFGVHANIQFKTIAPTFELLQSGRRRWSSAN